jgi:predicted amidophosphoribosyltransferase
MRAKFKADPVAAFLLCRFMVEIAEALPVREAECISSIPPDPARLRKRGIDLPGLLARKLAKRHGIPYERDLLVRIRNTPSQRGLSRAGRLRNLRHAFRAGVPAPQGRVLIVDDVYTTGATARAAVRALRKGGFRSVDFLVAAAAP